jgi:hypothetical protein
VIHEVDESIRNLLRLNLPIGTDVDVAFDAPTKDWASRRNAPTIDIYLYDIREDLRRREVGRFDHRSNGEVADRRQPPRWYKLSYLVTAWTQRPEDEHRLLAAMLQRFLLDDRLPDAVLSGSLADLGYPIPYTCGLPPPEDRALSDVWSALGGELKPSLDLVVTAPFDLGRTIPFGPPVLEGPQLVVAGAAKGTKRGRGKGKAAAGDAADETATGDAAAGGAHAAGAGGDSKAGGAAGGRRAGPGEQARLAAEERPGSRGGKAGRRLFITELPR